MIKLAHAQYDERGKATGGSAGDQTGKEVCVRTWYKSGNGWQYVIRPKNKNVADKIADTAYHLAKGNLVGYNQYDRLSLDRAGEKVDYDPRNIKTKCNCDCSSLVAFCVNSAGVKVSPSLYTGNELRILKDTGEFEILTDEKYLTSNKYLENGDILLRIGHTAICVEEKSVVDLQKAINDLDFKLAEDGIYGKLTNAALEKVKAVVELAKELDY